MRFNRVGKTYQLRIETPEDLGHILTLDESLWVATNAPTAAFRCDPRFLALVDSDSNGRIYTYELKDAVALLLDRMADRSRLCEGTDVLSLAAIRSGTPEGEALLASARYVLDILGEADDETISLDQVRRFMANQQSQPLNGDGVIVPQAAGDGETAGFIEDVLLCVGGTQDASGEQGVCQQHIDEFMTAVAAFLEWRSMADIPPGQSSTDVMTLGSRTPHAYEVYQQHAERVDLFFTLCRAERFRPGTASQPGRAESGPKDLSDSELVQDHLEKSSLARIDTDGLLPLSGDGLNPLYRQWVFDLKKHVLEPVLGDVPERLSEADWERVKSALAPYEAYLGQKKGASVEGLPAEKLMQYREGPLRERAMELMEADKQMAATLAGVKGVERLLLYQQNLMCLANNFVSFPQLYATNERALFEMGSAVLDGRWFTFAVKVDDVAFHSSVAKASRILVVYLEVSRTAAQQRFHVALPVTSGTKGNLSVGKRGVFFDINGKEYEARVIQIIENPVSFAEALVAPFVRLVQMVAGKIESFSGAAEKVLQTEVEQVVKVPQEPAPGVTQRAGGAAAMIAGIGLTVAALSSAFAFVVSKLAEAPHMIGLGLVGAVLVVLVPVSLSAMIRLRRQDLAALLEGCGWAVNARMRLTRAQRKHFTTRVSYPKGAEGTPRRRWALIVLVLAALAALLAVGYSRLRPFAHRGQKPEPAAAEPEGAVESETPPAGEVPVQVR